MELGAISNCTIDFIACLWVNIEMTDTIVQDDEAHDAE